MKVAIVHDYLNQYGGAERVLDEIHAIWPQAPVFVAIHDPRRIPSRYKEWDIRASWLNRVPLANRKHQMMLPLYPHVFENLDLSGYDLVISSSSGFAHGILTQPETCHICYLHSPPRFLWGYHDYVEREHVSGIGRVIVASQLGRLRVWDRVSAERPDSWISTSRVVQARAAKFYGKDSVIIPPPVDTNRFIVGTGVGEYFLMMMRLVGWKHPDIVVQACSRLGVSLVVAGDGREMARLKGLAAPNVRFVGRVDDFGMRDLYRNCRALILPSEEDFGITPLEAMASGRPVIAFGRGGVLDTVQHGMTGWFFHEQSADALISALTSFNDLQFDPARIRQQAEKFDIVIFREKIKQHATNVIAKHRERFCIT